MSDSGNAESQKKTHHKYLCSECGSVLWVPVGILENQRRHENRLFCECHEQGARLTRIHGPEGEVTV